MRKKKVEKDRLDTITEVGQCGRRARKKNIVLRRLDVVVPARVGISKEYPQVLEATRHSLRQATRGRAGERITQRARETEKWGENHPS